MVRLLMRTSHQETDIPRACIPIRSTFLSLIAIFLDNWVRNISLSRLYLLESRVDYRGRWETHNLASRSRERPEETNSGR
jgi:hypothetical protein